MLGWFKVLPLLAQDAVPKDPGLWPMAPLMVGIAVLGYLLLVMPQRKEQQTRDNFLKSLKQNDRVVTIGGMIGTVANISQDRKEFTLKVDDNTRIKFVRSGISHRLDDTPSTDATKPA